MQLNRHGYVFKKSFTSYLICFFDLCGPTFFRYHKQSELNPKRIVVLRLDHIGDMVAADAFIDQLRISYPESEILLFTSTAGQKVFSRRMVQSNGPINRVVAVDVAWFHAKSSAWSAWTSFFQLKKALKVSAADYVIDLRGDVRHILAARMALPASYIQSFGITGGGFLLNECHVPDVNAHAVMRNMIFLNHEVKEQSVGLSGLLSSEPLTPGLLPEVSNRIRIALHPSAGTLAKRWSAERWTELATVLMQHARYDLLWIGDGSCEEMYSEVAGSMNASFFERSVNLIGRIPLESLGSFLETCQVLVSPDSGPVHIAAAHHVPTVVLFSGTSLPEEWTPWKSPSHVLHKPVECSPCYRTVCNQPRHDCMLNIHPAEVLDAIEDLVLEAENNA